MNRVETNNSFNCSVIIMISRKLPLTNTIVTLTRAGVVRGYNCMNVCMG